MTIDIGRIRTELGEIRLAADRIEGCLPDPTPPAIPIPGLDWWERNCQLQAMMHCNPRPGSDVMYPYSASSAYYDGAWSLFQLADYTGNVEYEWGANVLLDIYMTYIEATGSARGTRVYLDGLVESYLRNGDQRAKYAAWKVHDHSAYTDTGGGPTGNLCRETALALRAYMVMEKRMGADHHPMFENAVGYLIGDLEQWYVTGGVGMELFMHGLVCQTLIEYLEFRPAAVERERITHLTKLSADWLWNNAWVEVSPTSGKTVQGFKYKKDSTTGTPDLNMFFAPMFAWLWRETGDDVYRQRGDLIFESGAKRCHIHEPYNGKQFAQYMYGAFPYIRLRGLPLYGVLPAPRVGGGPPVVTDIDIQTPKKYKYTFEFKTDKAATSHVEYRRVGSGVWRVTPELGQPFHTVHHFRHPPGGSIASEWNNYGDYEAVLVCTDKEGQINVRETTFAHERS